MINRQIVLSSRPSGLPIPDNFRLLDGAVPDPADGQVLIRHDYLGLAPAGRLRMSETASYKEPLALGDVMYGQATGVVVRSRNPAFKSGDAVVTTNGGWQEYSVAGGQVVSKIDPAVASPSVWLGALGTSGMTAYVGLLDIGQAKPGETVVVSAAGGAVGSVVGQIAKLKGSRVVGIAGGTAKVRHAIEEYGFDACVDYRADGFASTLKQACPNGVDVYFENVSGIVRDVVWPLMNVNGRVVVCGLIAEYNDGLQAGPGWFSVLTKRLSIRGFIMSDHLDRRPDFVRDMGGWYSEGRVRVSEDVSQGLEQAVPSFIGMLQGRNFGKTIVKL